MPTLADIYEKQAEECLRAAAKTQNPKHRGILLKLAHAWREDAEALKRAEELQLSGKRQKALRESVGIAYARGQKTEEVPQKVVSTAGSVEIAIMTRCRGKEVSTDVPLTSRDMGELALIAMLRDLSVAELVGQALAGAIKKDMIKEIMRSDVPSSSGAL